MPNPQPDYFHMFGRFMNQYANVESMVHALFRRMSSLPDAEARVISGGMRLTDVIQIIRRLARVKKLPEKPVARLENAFVQLAIIGELRDKLVHRGASISGDEITSTNARTARFKEDTEVITLKIKDIKAALLDLIAISLSLLLLYSGAPEFANMDARLTLPEEPWLYKPLPPETPYRQPRTGLQSPRHRDGEPQD
jgi:hypothetical protein